MRKNKGKRQNGCPDNEVFLHAFMRELPPEQMEPLISHILSCRKCRLKFDVLSELSQDLKAYENEVRSAAETEKEALSRLRGLRGDHVRISFWKVSAAAALILAVAAVGLYFLLFQTPVPERGLTGGELELVHPPVVVKKAPDHFEWTPVKDAAGYQFELIDNDLNTVFEGSTRETSLRLPEEIQSRLQTGRIYVWSVSAYNEVMVDLVRRAKHFTVE